jgi:hypothetical protein
MCRSAHRVGSCLQKVKEEINSILVSQACATRARNSKKSFSDTRGVTPAGGIYIQLNVSVKLSKKTCQFILRHNTHSGQRQSHKTSLLVAHAMVNKMTECAIVVQDSIAYIDTALNEENHDELNAVQSGFALENIFRQ